MKMKSVFYKWFVILICFISFMVLTGCNSSKELLESEITTDFIYRPTFQTVQGQLRAGTAFAVQVEGEERPIILTALHLFGSAGGLDEEVNARDLPEFVKQVDLYDLFEGDYIGSATETLLLLGTFPLSIDQAYAGNNYNPSLTVYGDVAAFYLQSDQEIETVTLSHGKLSAGDPVWLMASIYGGESANQKLHKGYVVIADEEQLVFRYEDSSINLQATSGAPILNHLGEVVGLNVGVRGGIEKLYGYANPAQSIRKYLRNAME